MFSIGSLIIYSSHGICHIDDISEKTVLGYKNTYYMLHPIDNPDLNISVPVDNESITMLSLSNKDECEIILNSFKYPGISWVEPWNYRYGVYRSKLKDGNRIEIAKLLNTLLRKSIQDEINEKKFGERDKKLLDSIKKVLFNELALSLNTTFESINEMVLGLIKENAIE